MWLPLPNHCQFPPHGRGCLAPAALLGREEPGVQGATSGWLGTEVVAGWARNPRVPWALRTLAPITMG